jgi:hypothetical protein
VKYEIPFHGPRQTSQAEEDEFSFSKKQKLGKQKTAR